MKTDWDYTHLAKAYLERPDYAGDVLERLFQLASLKPGDAVCDIGAGVAHLTLHLARASFKVTAVEPNDEMRRLGQERTLKLNNVRWFEGTGEHTGQESDSFRMVTFGSSFNVTDRQATLKEASRILMPHGWFACMWNHRDLEDPIQNAIETIIRTDVPAYGYGTRREDQTDVIEQSGLFDRVHFMEGSVLHKQSVESCVTAWRSHGTLERQAGPRFQSVVDRIETYLKSLNTPHISIPYTTRVWAAQLRK